MHNDIQELRCPECKGEGTFKIAATVWVKVAGKDAHDVLDEDGDREYGSEDACRCDACDHQARMGDFYKEDQDA